MDWDSYKKIYHQYELSVNQARVLRVIIGEILQDYPNRIPENLRTVLVKVPEIFLQMAKISVGLSENTKTPEEMQQELDGMNFSPFNSFHEIHTNPLYDPTMALLLAQLQLGISPSEISYERLLCHQELFMLFAHLDAFMADTLRAICKVRPEVLKKNKQIDWATIVSSGGWQELIDLLTEQYVFEFGWPPIAKRLKLLREQLGIELSLSDIDLELLEKAENIRHVIVHNGGRASGEYIRRTGQNDLAVGDFIPLTFEYLESVFEVSRILVSELFIVVSEKFFGQDTNNIYGVWRRASDEDSE